MGIKLNLNMGERLLGSKINPLTGGKTCVVGNIGERGATRVLETDMMGRIISETPVQPSANNILAYFGK